VQYHKQHLSLCACYSFFPANPQLLLSPAT
jgi:hypothetical protein